MNRPPPLSLAAGSVPRGFTMVELMVVVAIVAIGVALALPDWSSFLRRNKIQSATSELISAVSRARVEASSTGAANGTGLPYTVCASENSEAADVPGTPTPACTSPATADGWTAGAIVFADSNGNGLREAGEQLVMSIPPAPANLTITLNRSGPAVPLPRYVLYAPNGKLHGGVAGMRFTVAAAGSPVTENRYVCIQRGGRATALSHTALTADTSFAWCSIALGPL